MKKLGCKETIARASQDIHTLPSPFPPGETPRDLLMSGTGEGGRGKFIVFGESVGRLSQKKCLAREKEGGCDEKSCSVCCIIVYHGLYNFGFHRGIGTQEFYFANIRMPPIGTWPLEAGRG